MNYCSIAMPTLGENKTLNALLGCSREVGREKNPNPAPVPPLLFATISHPELCRAPALPGWSHATGSSGAKVAMAPLSTSRTMERWTQNHGEMDPEPRGDGPRTMERGTQNHGEIDPAAWRDGPGTAGSWAQHRGELSSTPRGAPLSTAESSAQHQGQRRAAPQTQHPEGSAQHGEELAWARRGDRFSVAGSSAQHRGQLGSAPPSVRLSTQ